MKIRKNAADASAADLSRHADALEADIQSLGVEQEALASAVALLDAEDMARLADVEALLPVKRRALDAVRTAESEARKREALEAFEADRRALDRATEKASKSFRQRYEKAAAEMVAVLEELRASHDAWDAMARRGRELGVRASGGSHLESRVRGNQIVGANARLLWPDAKLFGWDGVPIFGR